MVISTSSLPSELQESHGRMAERLEESEENTERTWLNESTKGEYELAKTGETSIRPTSSGPLHVRSGLYVKMVSYFHDYYMTKYFFGKIMLSKNMCIMQFNKINKIKLMV